MEILDFINKFIKILTSDSILHLNWMAYLVLALVFLVPFYISKWFEHIFFRIIFVLIGLTYLEQWGQQTITRDFNFLIGMGFIVPHIKYFFVYVKNIVFSILMFFVNLFIQLKNATVNTYFFFITIYYKILRLINWFINVFFVIKVLIENINERFKNKSEQKEYKQNYQEYSNKSEYKEEKQSYQDYSKSEQKQNSNNEKAYEDFKKSHGYNESKKEESTKQKVDERYKQFYSSSPYEVLGVKPSDDFLIIKKSYRALVRIYHPDLNPQNIELFTEITQNLNNAYEKLQKEYKK